MKYLLDFDRTVFDMDQLYQRISEQNSTAVLGTVESLVGIDLESLLFADALAFFATHKRDQIEIVSSCYGLTGQWELSYQQAKIKGSCIEQYAAATHVVTDSKISTIKRLARESDQVVYIDDHIEHIQNAVNHVPGLTVVHLDRTGTQPPIPGAHQVSSLAEISAIIL